MIDVWITQNVNNYVLSLFLSISLKVKRHRILSSILNAPWRLQGIQPLPYFKLPRKFSSLP